MSSSAAINIPCCSTIFPLSGWFTGFHLYYHHITDTAEKIDYAKMEKIVRLAYVTGFDFGDTATPPKFFPAGAPR